MYCVDKHGWPIERIKGRPIINAIRLCLHTRGIRRGRWSDRPKIIDCSTGTMTDKPMGRAPDPA